MIRPGTEGFSPKYILIPEQHFAFLKNVDLGMTKWTGREGQRGKRQFVLNDPGEEPYNDLQKYNLAPVWNFLIRPVF